MFTFRNDCELNQQRKIIFFTFVGFHSTEYPVSGICVLSQLSGTGPTFWTTGLLQTEMIRNAFIIVRFKTPKHIYSYISTEIN